MEVDNKVQLPEELEDHIVFGSPAGADEFLMSPIQGFLGRERRVERTRIWVVKKKSTLSHQRIKVTGTSNRKSKTSSEESLGEQKERNRR